jgi:hypothetical protein
LFRSALVVVPSTETFTSAGASPRSRCATLRAAKAGSGSMGELLG